MFLISLLYCQNTYTDSTRLKSPALAWKMSLIPGLGQCYNEKYIKSALFVSSISYSYIKKTEFSSLNKIAKRNTYSWWFFGLYLWGILDAYVDAHLTTFPAKNTIPKFESKKL